MNYQQTIEEYLGAFGMAQLLIIIAVGLPKIIMTWQVILLGVTGTTPEWWSESLHAEWVTTTIPMVQMVGLAIGAAIGGHLGDMIGRRRFLLMAFILQLVAVFIQAFSVSWHMLMICSFFTGAGFGGYLIPNNILILEFVGTKYRTRALSTPFWGLGTFTFGPILYAFPKWRHLSFVVAACGVPLLIFMWFFVPESVRWQLTKNKVKEAAVSLQKLAARNKRKDTLHSRDILQRCLNADVTEPTKESSYNYLSLFSSRKTRTWTIVLSFTWFSCSFIYYNLTLGVGQLSGDVTINFLIMGAGEILQSIIIWLLAFCMGRKTSTCLVLAFTGVSSGGITIAYFTTGKETFPTVMQVLAVISRTANAAAWMSVALVTIELFPTVMRALGYGFVSVVSRVGGIIATQAKFLSHLDAHWPFTVNGCLAVTSALLCLLLTETIATPMADYLEESDSPTESNEEEPRNRNKDELLLNEIA